MNAIQNRYLIHICIVLTVVLSVSAWFNIAIATAVGHKDGTIIRLISEYKRHDIRVTSLCAEGHVLLVSHSDVGQGGGLQMIQLQHDVDGKIVPMTCDLDELSSGS